MYLNLFLLIHVPLHRKHQHCIEAKQITVSGFRLMKSIGWLTNTSVEQTSRSIVSWFSRKVSCHHSERTRAGCRKTTTQQHIQWSWLKQAGWVPLFPNFPQPFYLIASPATAQSSSMPSSSFPSSDGCKTGGEKISSRHFTRSSSSGGGATEHQ